MNKAEFLNRVAEVLGHDGEIVEGQALQSIDEWDSLGILSVIDLLSELGVNVNLERLGEIQTSSELLELCAGVITHD